MLGEVWQSEGRNFYSLIAAREYFSSQERDNTFSLFIHVSRAPPPTRSTSTLIELFEMVVVWLQRQFNGTLCPGPTDMFMLSLDCNLARLLSICHAILRFLLSFLSISFVTAQSPDRIKNWNKLKRFRNASFSRELRTRTSADEEVIAKLPLDFLMKAYIYFERMNYCFNYLIIANLDGSAIIHPLEIARCFGFSFAIYQPDLIAGPVAFICIIWLRSLVISASK